MAILPVGDRFLVEQEKKEIKAGILLSEDDSIRRPIGVVLEVGNGAAITPSKIVAGDRICFNELAGERLSVDGKEYLLIRLEDVLAKLT